MKALHMRHNPKIKMAYTVDETSDALGIGRTAIYELFKTGELKFVKIAGRTLIPRSELERLVRVDRPE